MLSCGGESERASAEIIYIQPAYSHRDEMRESERTGPSAPTGLWVLMFVCLQLCLRFVLVFLVVTHQTRSSRSVPYTIILYV